MLDVGRRAADRRGGWAPLFLTGMAAAVPTLVIAAAVFALHRSIVVVAAGGLAAALLAAWVGVAVARGVHRGAERRLSDIAHNFPGVIFRRVRHADGRVSYPYVSPGAEILPDAEPAEWRDAALRSARTLEPFLYEGRIGAARWVRAVARPRREADGSVVWDGVVLDVSDLKEAEQRLAASLAEKDQMLREIHHRVRNNLQVVSSLIQIEAFQMRDAEDQRRLGDVSRRIGALGHLHELLYASADFARIECGQHLGRLCRTIEEAEARGRDVAVTVEAQHLFCDLDTAIPLGLIAHELITFELAHSDRLTVRLARTEAGAVTLAIDCGCGGAALADGSGLGSRILQALAAQIDASLRIGGSGTDCATLVVDGRRFTD